MNKQFDLEEFKIYCKKEIQEAYDEIGKLNMSKGIEEKTFEIIKERNKVQRALFGTILNFADNNKINSYAQLGDKLKYLISNPNYFDYERGSLSLHVQLWDERINTLIKEIELL